MGRQINIQTAWSSTTTAGQGMLLFKAWQSPNGEDEVLETPQATPQRLSGNTTHQHTLLDTSCTKFLRQAPHAGAGLPRRCPLLCSATHSNWEKEGNFGFWAWRFSFLADPDKHPAKQTALGEEGGWANQLLP